MLSLLLARSLTDPIRQMMAFAESVGAGVVTMILNSGQTCSAPSRMLVPAARMAEAIVQATRFYDDPKKIAEVSKGLGSPMRGIPLEAIPEEERLAVRGW